MKAVRFLVICATIWVSQCPNPCPDKKYFGPDCRYLNLRNFATQVIVNGNITINGQECYSASSKNPIKTVAFSWDGRHLSWVRVDVRNEQATWELDIKLWRSTVGLIKSSEKRMVSGLTVDVQFKDYGYYVTHILIEADVRSTCDIYISQGQNLAKNYPDRATASSRNGQAKAHRCVDGDVTTYFEELQQQEAWWKFVFPFPAVVYRVQLDYNFQDPIDREPAGNYIVQLYSTNDSIIFDTRRSKPMNSYDISINGDLASYLKVESNYIVNTTMKRLVFREIYIWGDYICKRSKFGPDCQHNCNSFDPKEHCFKNTGGCPGGCANGYKGSNCSVKCGLSNSECPYGCDEVNSGGCCGCPVFCTGPSCNGKEADCNGTIPGGASRDTFQNECTKNCTSEGDKCKKRCNDGYQNPTPFSNELAFYLLIGCLSLILVLLLMCTFLNFC